jgi:hypothetical protein
MASSMVSPSDIEPGISGYSTSQPPPSFFESGCIAIRFFGS